MAGIFPNFPGQPDPTGKELVALDLPAFLSSSFPETVAMTGLQIAGSIPRSFRNLLLGGDFSTNPWQRGTSFTTISNTLTYTADRFFALGGASSSISVSRQAVSAGDIPGTGNIFTQALQFGRAAANADTAAIQLGQALESVDSVPLRGKQVTLSFWAKAGANFSAAGGVLGLKIASGTGTDGSAANLAAGSWTGYSERQLNTVQNGGYNYGANAQGNPSSGIGYGAVLTPVTGVQLSTAWQRYFVTAAIPANAAQVGVLFNYTPVGTAGSNDWFQLAGVQLEEVSDQLPFPTPFEGRKPALERLLCQRYCFQLNEKGTAAAVQANGIISATNVQTIAIPLQVPMRTTPTVTVSAGTWRFNIAGTLTAVGGGFAAGGAATQAPDCINVVGAVTATVGQGTQLVSGAATWGGYIRADAEL